MERLAQFDEIECNTSDQLYPALDRAKVPGSRIGKIFAEACPRPLAPAIDVPLISSGNHRMQCLNHQRSTRVDQSRCAPQHSLDRFLSDQPKIRHRHTNAAIGLTR